MAAGHRQVRVRICEDLDVFEARWSIRTLARELGFPHRDTEELVILVSELATNVLKFGPPGAIVMEPVTDEAHGPGVRIAAIDSAPPIADFDRVIARSAALEPPPTWTGRGLGAGLGAVFRFSDRLRSEGCEAGGKQVIAERYRRRPRPR